MEALDFCIFIGRNSSKKAVRMEATVAVGVT
jgi:hypothetical protein